MLAYCAKALRIGKQEAVQRDGVGHPGGPADRAEEDRVEAAQGVDPVRGHHRAGGDVGLAGPVEARDLEPRPARRGDREGGVGDGDADPVAGDRGDPVGLHAASPWMSISTLWPTGRVEQIASSPARLGASASRRSAQACMARVRSRGGAAPQPELRSARCAVSTARSTISAPAMGASARATRSEGPVERHAEGTRYGAAADEVAGVERERVRVERQGHEAAPGCDGRTLADSGPQMSPLLPMPPQGIARLRGALARSAPASAVITVRTAQRGGSHT